MGWLYRLIDVDPEQWVWRWLCYTSLGLAVLKLAGEVTLSWWWIVLPVLLPFVGTAGMVVLCVLVMCLLPADWDRKDHSGEF